MKYLHYVLLICVFSLPGISHAQDTLYRVYTMDSIFSLAQQHNQSLKVSASDLGIAAQTVDVAKSRRLPTVTASLTAGYLGDVHIIEKDFSGSTRVPMPHFANSLSVQASQMIFNGNSLNKSIANASLQEQITALNLDEDVLNVKLLVASNYLDLYTLYNQNKVYDKNLELAKLRLKQIQKLYQAGMVTRNDVIRSELQIADLNLAKEVVLNQVSIINQRLTIATGLPSTLFVLPDTNILESKSKALPYAYYENQANLNYPSLKTARVNSEIAENNVDIAKAALLPSLSAYAGSNLNRPLTSSSPAADLYSHGWQTGLTLSFNVDALYKAPQQIRLNKLYLQQRRELEILEEQNRSMALNSAYIMHKQAISQWKTLEQNMFLANENYRIIEKKYLNQLALFIDMLDASNAKLNAELNYTNAEIKILYTNLQLQKEAGKL